MAFVEITHIYAALIQRQNTWDDDADDDDGGYDDDADDDHDDDELKKHSNDNNDDDDDDDDELKQHSDDNDDIPCTYKFIGNKTGTCLILMLNAAHLHNSCHLST